jgi:hypothetical protein
MAVLGTATEVGNPFFWGTSVNTPSTLSDSSCFMKTLELWVQSSCSSDPYMVLLFYLRVSRVLVCFTGQWLTRHVLYTWLAERGFIPRTGCCSKPKKFARLRWDRYTLSKQSFPQWDGGYAYALRSPVTLYTMWRFSMRDSCSQQRMLFVSGCWLDISNCVFEDVRSMKYKAESFSLTDIHKNIVLLFVLFCIRMVSIVSYSTRWKLLSWTCIKSLTTSTTVTGCDWNK